MARYCVTQSLAKASLLCIPHAFSTRANLLFVVVAVLLVRESEKLRLADLFCLLSVYLEILHIWFLRRVRDSRDRFVTMELIVTLSFHAVPSTQSVDRYFSFGIDHSIFSRASYIKHVARAFAALLLRLQVLDMC